MFARAKALPARDSHLVVVAQDSTAAAPIAAADAPALWCAGSPGGPWSTTHRAATRPAGGGLTEDTDSRPPPWPASRGQQARRRMGQEGHSVRSVTSLADSSPPSGRPPTGQRRTGRRTTTRRPLGRPVVQVTGSSDARPPDGVHPTALSPRRGSDVDVASSASARTIVRVVAQDAVALGHDSPTRRHLRDDGSPSDLASSVRFRMIEVGGLRRVARRAPRGSRIGTAHRAGRRRRHPQLRMTPDPPPAAVTDQHQTARQLSAREPTSPSSGSGQAVASFSASRPTSRPRRRRGRTARGLAARHQSRPSIRQHGHRCAGPSTRRRGSRRPRSLATTRVLVAHTEEGSLSEGSGRRGKQRGTVIAVGTPCPEAQGCRAQREWRQHRLCSAPRVGSEVSNDTPTPKQNPVARRRSSAGRPGASRVSPSGTQRSGHDVHA